MASPNKSKTLLGATLRRARICAGLKAEELGEQLEITAGQVLRWEWGESEPRFKSLRAMAKIYGLTVGQLVDGVAPQLVVPPGEDAEARAAGERP